MQDLNPEPEVWTVPPGVLEALQAPKPTTEADELIASAGLEWPIQAATYTEVLTDTFWSFDV